MEKNYYVYIHTCLLNQKVYIGITRQKPERRWRRGANYKNNPYFYNAIQKYGWDNFNHEVVFSNLSKNEAEIMEIKLISLYSATNRKFGYNIDNGGSVVGRFTEETKKKMQSAHLGKKLSKEHKDNIAKSLIGNNYAKGKKLSVEHKQKLLNSNIGRKTSNFTIQRLKEELSKSVFKLDVSGNIIEKYSSITEASEKNSVSISCISRACNSQQNGANGYLWMYCADFENYNGDFSEFKILEHTKKVAQYDSNGNFIKTYKSLSEATKAMDLPSPYFITQCCKRKKEMVAGFVWKFE